MSNLDPLECVESKFEQVQEVLEYAKEVFKGLRAWEEKAVTKYLKPPQKLLDIGCGCGREALSLAEKGFHITAVDLVPGMVEFTQNLAVKLKLPIETKVMNACSLDFPAEFFDGALMVEQFLGGIPGYKNRLKAVKEVWRVLKPGGLFIMNGASINRDFFRTVYWYFVNLSRKNKRYPALEEGDMWRHKVDGAESKGAIVVHYFTLAEGKRLLEESGFLVLEKRSVTDFVQERFSGDPGFCNERDYALVFIGQKPTK